MDKLITIENVLLYLIIINVIGFLAMEIDKDKARRRKLAYSGEDVVYNYRFGWWSWYYFGNVCF